MQDNMRVFGSARERKTIAWKRECVVLTMKLTF